jgi:hypothetical protein
MWAKAKAKAGAATALASAKADEYGVREKATKSMDAAKAKATELDQKYDLKSKGAVAAGAAAAAVGSASALVMVGSHNQLQIIGSQNRACSCSEQMFS